MAEHDNAMSPNPAVDRGVDIKAPQGRRRQLRVPAWAGLPLVIVLIAIGGELTTSGYLASSNLSAILLAASITGIAAVGMSFVTLSGNFFSLGTQQVVLLCAVIFASAIGDGWSVVLAIAVIALLSVVLGVGQGVVISAGLNPVITTLALGGIAYGVAANTTGGETIFFGTHSQDWLTMKLLGIRFEVYVFAVVTALATIVIAKTVVGRHIMLLGANRATAEMSGISARRTTTWAFVLFSCALGLCAILRSAELGNASINLLPTFTVETVAAVLVGGIAVQGGYGSPIRAAGGAIIITMLTNLMILHHFSPGGRQTAVGAIALIIVVILELVRRREGQV